MRTDKFNDEYQDKVLTLEWLFSTTRALWDEIVIDFYAEPPESFNRLYKTAQKLLSAITEFKKDIT